jgi:hypothetical protein
MVFEKAALKHVIQSGMNPPETRGKKSIALEKRGFPFDSNLSALA